MPFCKQGFFVSQTRLLCFSINASLFLKQDFFAMHPSLVCAKTKPLWRTPTCYVCLFIFLLFYLFTLKYCCPVKTFSYGFREAGPLCETHCKPQSGAAVGGQGCKGRFPEGELMPLTVSRMCKSRFAEHYPSMQLHPQLHRFAACSGFRI